MLRYSQSQQQWEIIYIYIAAYLTQRKLNTYQTIAYLLEKQDSIPNAKNITKNLSKTHMKQSAESNSFEKFKVIASLPILCPSFRFFLKKEFSENPVNQEMKN